MLRWLPKALCLLVLIALAPLAHAQIYRCVGAQGEPVFSGEPCGTPAPSASVAGSSSRFAGVCAQSPAALRRDITKAFTGRNVNLLAGLILWDGVDQASARATLRALSAWLQQPLIGIAIAYPARPPPPVPGLPAVPASAVAATAPPTGFRVSTTADTRDFGVTQQGCCWWLTF